MTAKDFMLYSLSQIVHFSTIQTENPLRYGYRSEKADSK